MVKRGVSDIEDAYDRIEGATITHMTEVDAFNVVGNGAFLLGDSQDIAWGDINELPERIDEAADQPGAGDAVDLGVLAGYPLVQRRADVATGWQTAVVPAGKAIHQIACIGSEPPE